MNNTWFMGANASLTQNPDAAVVYGFGYFNMDLGDQPVALGIFGF